MSTRSTRRGITQAHYNHGNSAILFVEIFIISILVGIAFMSWWAFGGALLGLNIVLAIRPLALILCFLLSLAWGGVGVLIGTLIGNTGAMVVIGILALLAGLGVHLSGLEWMEDLGGE